MSTNTAAVTIDQLEALAVSLEQTDAEQRAKLLRMIRAEARILAVREPAKFQRKALEHGDEDGHFDGSYPPKQVFKNCTGPRLVRVHSWSTDDIATEGGFYYTWKRVTTDPGLYVARDGTIYGCDEHGTGKLGQFAAHPGDCDVECELDWDPRDLDNVTTEELATVESHMRALAFPASAKPDANTES